MAETKPTPINRRRVVAAAAWSVPAVALASAAPAFAASAGVTITLTNVPVSTNFGAVYPTFQARVVNKNGQPVAGETVTVTLTGPGRFGSAGSSTLSYSGVTDANGVLTLNNVYASAGETGTRNGQSEQGPIGVVASIDNGQKATASLSRNVDVAVYHDAPYNIFDSRSPGFQVVTNHALPATTFNLSIQDWFGNGQILPASFISGNLPAQTVGLQVIGGNIQIPTKAVAVVAKDQGSGNGAGMRMNVHFNPIGIQLATPVDGSLVIPPGYVDTNSSNNVGRLRCTGAVGLLFCVDR